MDKILVAVDFSDSAPALLKYATELADDLKAKLVFCHAVAVPPELPAEVYRLSTEELTDWLCQEAESKIERIVRDLPNHLEGTSVIMVGAPARVIMDVADDEKADLILLGSRGHSLLERLIGTVARHVVEKARQPVLVFKHGSP